MIIDTSIYRLIEVSHLFELFEMKEFDLYRMDGSSLLISHNNGTTSLWIVSIDAEFPLTKIEISILKGLFNKK